jgi:hypothetical protein
MIIENYEEFYCVLFRTRLFVIELESAAVLFKSVNTTTVVMD